jgi:protein TonB
MTGEGEQGPVRATPPQYALGAADTPAPVYPRQARREGWEGRVTLFVSVGPDGRAHALSVRQSSGHAVLDDAAVEAVRRWRFSPARRAGIPVAGQVIVPILFRLEN